MATQPVMHPRDAILSLIDLLSVVADNAEQIAQSKRKIFRAYIKEGLTETQALELVKNATGITGGL